MATTQCYVICFYSRLLSFLYRLMWIIQSPTSSLFPALLPRTRARSELLNVSLVSSRVLYSSTCIWQLLTKVAAELMATSRDVSANRCCPETSAVQKLDDRAGQVVAFNSLYLRLLADMSF
jgi:hypothetical protein